MISPGQHQNSNRSNATSTSAQNALKPPRPFSEDQSEPQSIQASNVSPMSLSSSPLVPPPLPPSWPANRQEQEEHPPTAYKQNILQRQPEPIQSQPPGSSVFGQTLQRQPELIQRQPPVSSLFGQTLQRQPELIQRQPPVSSIFSQIIQRQPEANQTPENFESENTQASVPPVEGVQGNTNLIAQANIQAPQNSNQRQQQSTEAYRFPIRIPGAVSEQQLLTLTLSQVFNISEDDAERFKQEWRWSWTNPVTISPEQLEARIVQVTLQKSDYIAGVEHLSGINPQEIDQRLGDAQQRRDNFYTSGSFELYNASLIEITARYNRLTGEQITVGQPPNNRQLYDTIQDQFLLEQATLETLSPTVQYLLGGRESFQPQNYQRLLRVGNKLQQLSPDELEYIYKSLARDAIGDLDRLERSINVFSQTRNQTRSQLQGPTPNYSGQEVNNLLFGNNPVTEDPSWQQVLKDLIASVKQSLFHAPEVLGELFEYLQEHWVEFVALTVALIGAEAVIVLLTGTPEPTFLTKVIAVALQGFILAVYGVGIAVSVGSAINELMEWWNIASTANGDPEKIGLASRAFLRMLGNLLLVVISSRQFQDQISPQKLARLQAMLSRQPQRPTSLPNTYEGLTLDLVPDPNNPGTYVYQVQSNAPALPPSTRSTVPDLDPAVRPPSPTRPNSGGTSGGTSTSSTSITSGNNPQVPVSPSQNPTSRTPVVGTGSNSNLPSQPGSLSQNPASRPVVGTGSNSNLPPQPGSLSQNPASRPSTLGQNSNPNSAPAPYAEPPQRLDIVPNINPRPPQQPNIVPNNTSRPNGDIPEPIQGIDLSGNSSPAALPPAPQTSAPQVPAHLSSLAELLATALSRPFNPEELQANSQGEQLSNEDVEQLVRSAGNWNQVKANYLNYPKLMERIIKYREDVVFQTVGAVLNSDPRFRNLDTLATDKQGEILGNLVEMIIAGSNDLTSDYDITFSADQGNESLEILAVERFNQSFRQQWGLESGFVFDTNVYTSGHMRAAAFKGDGAKLSLVNKLAKKVKDIRKAGNPTADQISEVNGLVNEINSLQSVNVSISLPQLEVSNFNQFILQLEDLQQALIAAVRQQYQSSQEAYGVGEEFDELALVTSLVHMREFWHQEQHSQGQQNAGTNWNYVEQQMTGNQVPEAVRNTNQSRLERVNSIHTELVSKRDARIRLLREQYPNEPEKNIEMRANNELYVEYLREVEAQLAKLRAAQNEEASAQTLQSLRLQLQEIQSQALFFANEAYLTAAAAEQVVLNQQLGLGVKLPTMQYLVSINEQTAFIGEQIAHSEHSPEITLPLGRSLWKTAKYIDRLLSAIEKINGDTQGLVPNQEVMEQVEALRPLINNLLHDIKKNEALNDIQKDQKAEELAQENSSVLGSNTSELRKIILDLQIKVNLQVQQNLDNNNSAP